MINNNEPFYTKMMILIIENINVIVLYYRLLIQKILRLNWMYCNDYSVEYNCVTRLSVF